jgi:hypothetical protein
MRDAHGSGGNRDRVAGKRRSLCDGRPHNGFCAAALDYNHKQTTTPKELESWILPLSEAGVG